MSNAAISATKLTKKFGDFTAVDHVSFEVQKGEIFGLLGPNGAGKSTAIRMLSTLSAPTEGTATVAGFDIQKEDGKVREHIGLVSEKMIMYDELKARENLTLFGKLYDIPSAILRKRIDKLLAFVRMEQWADHRIDTFSTGMKQRINVIRALVNEPDVLFLDEPTLGLDPQSTAEIRELVRRINIENKTTIILTTHMMTEADMLCDKIGILDRGKIVALDTPENLKRSITGTDSNLFEFEIPNLDADTVSTVKGLGAVGSVVRDDPTHIRVSAVGNDSFDILVDALRKSGAKIRTVKNLEPTLEDVFLKITGHEVRDGVTKAPSNMHKDGPWRAKARVR
jgi:ABC-2 type transport system ATP-binding protein